MSWMAVAVGLAAVSAAACLALVSEVRRLTRGNAALSARNQELERTSAARTRFVATMSHELRTPLNAVIGFAELLDDGRAGPITEAQHEHLAIVRSSADHLVTLVDEVLDLASIEAGHMRLDAEPVAPGLLAEQCVNSMRPLADDRHVQIELQPSATFTVPLDPARLRQVILNYLSNAIRFTPPGGRVTVTLAQDASGLRIEVADTGIGISPDDQVRIFEEFVQVGSAHRDGSGLGLAVTRQIVRAQGGHVGVTSELGRGSTFHAWLPCRPTEDHGRGSVAPTHRRRRADAPRSLGSGASGSPVAASGR